VQPQRRDAYGQPYGQGYGQQPNGQQQPYGQTYGQPPRGNDPRSLPQPRGFFPWEWR
jgi:hypothetical protein